MGSGEWEAGPATTWERGAGSREQALPLLGSGKQGAGPAPLLLGWGRVARSPLPAPRSLFFLARLPFFSDVGAGEDP